MDIKIIGGVLCDEEIEQYIKHVKSKTGAADIRSLTIHVDGDFVDLEWHFEQPPFDRIRRITGYLVGTLDRFNDGKRAEEHDRIKHTTND